MKKLILHIGAPKCGSSTIQSLLGKHLSGRLGLKNRFEETLKYACLLNNGEVLIGPSLLNAQNKSVSNYVASAILPDNPDEILGWLKNLNNAVGKDDIVILSNEGWANRLLPSFEKALNQLAVPVEVLFIVRAPVDWMNSGWWQWGVWGEASLESWVKSQMPAVNFYSQFERWSNVGTVERIKVAEISQGLVQTLADFLSIDSDTFKVGKNVNVGTNFHLLRHLINNKEKYGRKTHAPYIEFKLNQILDASGTPPPFVINSELAKDIIKGTMPSNIKILEEIRATSGVVSTEVAAKYLDSDSYNNKESVDLSDALSAAENDEFIGMLIDRILSIHDNQQPPKSVLRFDPKRYLSLHPDVEQSGINPYEHYVRFGLSEGRRI